MKKILCPTDFSETAQNSIAYAAKIAQVSNAELVLFHEHSLWSLSTEEIIMGSNVRTARIAEELEEACAQISQAFHISCTANVVASGQTLVSLIEKYEDEFDLIVMGIDNRFDFLTYLAGSRAFQVSKNTRLPLVLVPKNYVFKSIDHIAFAFDPIEKRETNVTQLTEWAEIWKSEVSLLEAVHSDKQVVTAVGESKGSLQIPVEQIEKAHTASSIHAYMISGKADMLALYSRNRGFFERLFHASVIKDLSSRAVYPLFIFHE